MDIFSNGLLREFDCVCKKRHVFSSMVYDGHQMEDALLNLLPQGSHILYMGCDGLIKKRLGKLYRITAIDPAPCDTRQDLNKKNFGDTDCTESDTDNGYQENQPAQENNQEPTKAFVSLNKLDDIRLVVSNGECENAKYIAMQANVPHIILGGGNLSEYAYVQKDGFVFLTRCKAPQIVCEESLIDCAAGFADVALAALSLFEWNLSSITSGERPCPVIFKEALKTISSLFAAARQFPRQSPQLKSAVLEARLRLAVLSGYLNSPQLIINGAFQSAAAMTRLFWHEKREIKPLAITALLISPLVAKAYSAFLQLPIGFCPPADNNLRAGKINEYLGIEEEKAMAMMPEYLPNPQLEHIDYRLNLYREELLMHLNQVAGQLDEAVLLFFKLCEDDGFSFKNYVDSLDTSLCIGIGSDILKGSTLLDFMRHKGVLDRYVL